MAHIKNVPAQFLGRISARRTWDLMDHTNLRWLPRPIAVALGLVMLLGALACNDFLGPSSRQTDHLVFLSARDGATTPAGETLREIYRVNVDGSGLVNLTRDPANYRVLTVAPDGRTLLYNALVPPGFWITDTWSMAIDGSNRKLVASRARTSPPHVSPDGVRIAFDAATVPMGDILDAEIVVANIDGTDMLDVSAALPPTGDLSVCYHWSGRAHHIHVQGWISNDRLLVRRLECVVGYRNYLVFRTGAEVSEAPSDIMNPYASPDGTRIAFEISPTGTLHIVSSDDFAVVHAVQGPIRLPSDGDASPSPWSPDGSRVYFKLANSSHHILTVDTGEITALALPPASATFSGWSFGGDRIAWTTENGVYISDADGGRLVQVPGMTANDRNVRWVRGR